MCPTAELEMENWNQPDERENSTNQQSKSEQNTGGVKLDRNMYLKYCKSVLRAFDAKSLPLDLSGESVASYSLGQVSWRDGELPSKLASKYLFSVLSEAAAVGEPSGAMYISLKGKHPFHNFTEHAHNVPTAHAQKLILLRMLMLLGFLQVQQREDWTDFL